MGADGVRGCRGGDRRRDPCGVRIGAGARSRPRGLDGVSRDPKGSTRDPLGRSSSGRRRTSWRRRPCPWAASGGGAGRPADAARERRSEGESDLRRGRREIRWEEVKGTNSPWRGYPRERERGRRAGKGRSFKEELRSAMDEVEVEIEEREKIGGAPKLDLT